MPITDEGRQRFIKFSLNEFDRMMKQADTPAKKMYVETLRALFHVSEGLSWDCSKREDFRTVPHSGVMLTYTKAMAHTMSMIVGDQCKPGLEEILVEVLAEQFRKELLISIRTLQKEFRNGASLTRTATS